MKINIQRGYVIALLFFLPFAINAQGLNGWLKKQKNKLLNKIDTIANSKVDNLINGKSNTANYDAQASNPSQTKGGSSFNHRPRLSELQDVDFMQNLTNPPLDSINTRIMISKNLLVDIKDKYPVGYNPKWRFVSYSSPLDFDVEDWVFPSTELKHGNMNIAIGDYQGKAVLRFPAYMSCDCYADITIDSFTVLTPKPQTFKLTNFQKIINGRTTGEKCRSEYNYWYLTGGWEGKITLSADDNGNIKMAMVVESYTSEYHPSYQKEAVMPQVYLRYKANNINIDNEMTAEKANKIITAENEAKQKQKDYLVNSKKQIDSLTKLIVKKYPGTECKSCFYRSRGYSVDPNTTNYYYVNSGNYAGSKTDYDLNTSLVIKNKCDYQITFIGIQQLYDENKGYYYKDVTKTMDAGYEYSVNQGMFTYALTSVLGMNSDFTIQDEYSIGAAFVNQVQWIRVIRNKK